MHCMLGLDIWACSTFGGWCGQCASVKPTQPDKWSLEWTASLPPATIFLNFENEVIEATKAVISVQCIPFPQPPSSNTNSSGPPKKEIVREPTAFSAPISTVHHARSNQLHSNLIATISISNTNINANSVHGKPTHISSAINPINSLSQLSVQSQPLPLSPMKPPLASVALQPILFPIQAEPCPGRRIRSGHNLRLINTVSRTKVKGVGRGGNSEYHLHYTLYTHAQRVWINTHRIHWMYSVK